MYQVIARRWRPQTFAEVIGQEHITQTLQSAISGQKVAHAYLFAGIRGVGKTTCARIMAKALNCKSPVGTEPCNQCLACVGTTDGSSPDVVEIDGASNNSVEDIRSLRENIGYMPVSGRYRVYIIDEVHMLSKSAFNALLKTLEEPPEHVVFILATTEVPKMPLTILSRCQRYTFRRIPERVLQTCLQKIAISEGQALSAPVLEVISMRADGSLRDGQSLLEQVLVYCSTKECSDQELLALLGRVDRSYFVRFVRAVIEQDYLEVSRMVAYLYNEAFSMDEFYDDLARFLHRLLLAVKTGHKDPAANQLETELFELLATKGQALARIVTLLISERENMRLATNKRIFLDVLFMRAADMAESISLSELQALLERIEGQGPVAPAAPSATYATPKPQPAYRPAPPSPRHQAPAPQQPATPTVAQNIAPAPKPVPRSLDPQIWYDFVESMPAKKQFLLYGYLQGVKIKDSGADSIQLIFADDANFAKSAVDKTTMRTALEQLLSEHLGGTKLTISTAIANGLPKAMGHVNPKLKPVLDKFEGRLIKENKRGQK